MNASLFPFLYSLLITQQGGNSKEARQFFLANAREVYADLPSLKSMVESLGPTDVISDLSPLYDDLKALYTKSLRDPAVNSAQRDMMKAFASWFKSKSESAYARLDKMSGLLGLPWIESFFVKDLGSQGPIAKQLQKLVKGITGRNDIALQPEEVATLKAQDPDTHKQYLGLRRDYNQVWKDALSTYVRSQGTSTVPYQEVLQFFKKNGIQHSMALGFTGLIDSQGRWYAADGEILNGVPSSTVFPRVEMNPNYGNGQDWIAIGVRADGSRSGYLYKQSYRKEQMQNKFGKVAELMPKIEAMRKKWSRLITTWDGGVQSTAACILEVLYYCSGRVGTPGNRNGTFGVSTLQVKHCKRTAQGFKLKYLGKDNVQQEHVILRNNTVHKKLCDIVDQLCEGKKPADPLWTYALQNGTLRQVQPAMVNSLFKSMGAPDGVTVHKLRTAAATKIMAELIEAHYAKVSSYNNPAKALEDLRKMAMEVGKTLGHVRRTKEGGQEITPNTALVNYIDAALQMEFFEHYNIPYPKYLEKLTASVLDDEDFE